VSNNSKRPISAQAKDRAIDSIDNETKNDLPKKNRPSSAHARMLRERERYNEQQIQVKSIQNRIIRDNRDEDIFVVDESESENEHEHEHEHENEHEHEHEHENEHEQATTKNTVDSKNDEMAKAVAKSLGFGLSTEEEQEKEDDDEDFFNTFVRNRNAIAGAAVGAKKSLAKKKRESNFEALPRSYSVGPGNSSRLAANNNININNNKRRPSSASKTEREMKREQGWISSINSSKAQTQKRTKGGKNGNLTSASAMNSTASMEGGTGTGARKNLFSSKLFKGPTPPPPTTAAAATAATMYSHYGHK